ncbi:MAG: tRNA (adenosine(37)-N6)-dimethylallyltransferase MiaA [Nitrospinae bacterium]|nr:tRNA (adenosine(37)-N6)-dimethylallyltransferase MiaA [Nitrospinota bacterium]
MCPDNPDAPPPLLVIAGPTACGKTETGVIVAERLGTEIISADSVQVYKHFDIGSAKPTARQLARVKHHLVSVAGPDENYTVGMFREQAEAIARDMWRRVKIPLVVGGTGLYIKALTEGLHCGVRADERTELCMDAIEAAEGLAGLYKRAVEADPVWMAKIHPNDNFRIRRCLGVFLATGKTMSGIYARNPNRPEWDALVIVISPDRKVLYDRIGKRVDEMMEEGWREEVKRLKEKGYNEKTKPMRALGYKTLLREIEGAIPAAQSAETIKKETRNFAKRQITWFKKVENAICIPAGAADTASAVADAIFARTEVAEYFARHRVAH